jgi:hypothetical protein
LDATSRDETPTEQLETVGAGLLLLLGWLTFAGMACALTYFLLIPICAGYALLGRARAIRERRILRVFAISLASASATLWVSLLWGVLNHEPELVVER